MIKMSEDNGSTKWILAIVGASLTGFLYLVCCICSIQKALKDRKGIIERNCVKRNNKYLKDMGIDSQKPASQNEKTTFAISKKADIKNPIVDITIKVQESPETKESLYPPTKAKKINLDDIDEILNESVSINASTSSSLVAKTISETSQTCNLINNDNLKPDQPMVTSLRKPIIIDSIPKVYYLKAHNSHGKEKTQPSNWITERLTTASSYADAQRQLQHGLKRAPLAKQNSGFSSMDEDSSASYNY